MEKLKELMKYLEAKKQASEDMAVMMITEQAREKQLETAKMFEAGLKSCMKQIEVPIIKVQHPDVEADGMCPSCYEYVIGGNYCSTCGQRLRR